jgi:predicted nucleic acid-binding protein
LDEVVTFLFSKAPAPLAVKYLKELIASVKSGSIQLERIGLDRFESAWKMRLKYQDQGRISFTDFTSFVVLQEISAHRVLTNDRHFEQVNLGFQKLP